MHYYQFNIGDYRRDTTHLSRLEHSIYRDLIDWYYLEEQPIPLETQSVSRRLRLATQEEANALKNVLTDFFEESDEGYRHSRIDDDIAKYRQDCEKNRANGMKGGRPKVAPIKEENPVGSQSVTTGKPRLTEPKANQEPITKNQEPITKNQRKDPSASAAEAELQAACREAWSAYSAAFRGRYGTEPVRNAKVNSSIKGFVQRVGREEAPHIADFYLSHSDSFYVRHCHDVAYLQKDAEKLRTEWATNRKVTGITARQQERTGTMADTVQSILLERGMA